MMQRAKSILAGMLIAFAWAADQAARDPAAFEDAIRKGRVEVDLEH